MKKSNKAKGKREDKKAEKIKLMIAQLDAIKEEALRYEKIYKKSLKRVHPGNLVSAKNLIHYRSLRLHDLTKLQKNLGNMGLSRLATTQRNVMAGLETTKSILKAFLGKKPKEKRTGLSHIKANRLIKRSAKQLMGYRSAGRHTRIMVTLPIAAAWDYELVEQMIANGMNCARINCAHDREEDWLKMIEHIRKASKKLSKKCKIAMDLGGPKIRTGPIIAGPKVKKFKPIKNVRGKIEKPLYLRIGPTPSDEHLLPWLPISQDALLQQKPNTQLYFLDARNKKRRIDLLDYEEVSMLASVSKTCYFETGMKLYMDKSLSGSYITVGELPPVDMPIILHKGDYLKINRSLLTGENTKYDAGGKRLAIAHISCTLPEVFDFVKIGDPILFDDGKIAGIVKGIESEAALVEITQAKEGGGKLSADKGLNLPDTNLEVSGLTSKDKTDLKFVVQYADVVNLSFVNSRLNVKELIWQLKDLKAPIELGVILKIETKKGFNNLTEILIEAMRLPNIGVMIARGDLAIETGWANIGRVQQEILAICEAAHVPGIWATQVLENLAKTGMPSRAEITDVVKAQQADCIMLNKGKYILRAIKFLSEVLKDLEGYHEKSKVLTPALKLTAVKN